MASYVNFRDFSYRYLSCYRNSCSSRSSSRRIPHPHPPFTGLSSSSSSSSAHPRRRHHHHRASSSSSSSSSSSLVGKRYSLSSAPASLVNNLVKKKILKLQLLRRSQNLLVNYTRKAKETQSKALKFCFRHDQGFCRNSENQRIY